MVSPGRYVYVGEMYVCVVGGCIRESGEGVWLGRPVRIQPRIETAETMLIAKPIVCANDYLCLRRRFSGLLQEVSDVHDSICQVERVTAADKKVQPALQLWTKHRPITAHDVAKIIILAPVSGHRAIQFACQFVVQASRKPVLANGRKHLCDVLSSISEQIISEQIITMHNMEAVGRAKLPTYLLPDIPLTTGS